MEKNILNEDNEIRQMMGLVNEQQSTKENFQNFLKNDLVPTLKRLGFKKETSPEDGTELPMSDVYEDGGFKFKVREIGPGRGWYEDGKPGVKISSSFDVTPLKTIISNTPETEWSNEQKEAWKKEESIEYNIKYIDWFSNQDGKTWFDKKTNTYHSSGVYFFSETGTNNLKESLDSMEETFKRLRDINDTI